MPPKMHNSPLESDTATQALLAQVGVDKVLHVKQFVNSRNNRVYRVESDLKQYFVKEYFTHPDDPRDRLQTEFGFSQFAWDHGIREVAEPLAADSANNLVVYEWIEGRRLAAVEVGEEHVRAAIDFFCELNTHRDHPDAQSLPDASEACFSIRDHIARVESRVGRLSSIEDASQIHAAAVAWVQADLIPAWESCADLVTGVIGPQQKVARCLSPSDFGFHNALVEKTGRLRFFDFEYAGWDDAAKMICDFFCQPEIPVPVVYLDTMIDRVAEAIPDDTDLRERVRVVLPVYRIKWCTIMMNEFLPTSLARRNFADEHFDERRLAEQLEAARRTLSSLAD